MSFDIQNSTLSYHTLDYLHDLCCCFIKLIDCVSIQFTSLIYECSGTASKRAFIDLKSQLSRGFITQRKIKTSPLPFVKEKLKFILSKNTTSTLKMERLTSLIYSCFCQASLCENVQSRTVLLSMHRYSLLLYTTLMKHKKGDPFLFPKTLVLTKTSVAHIFSM